MTSHGSRALAYEQAVCGLGQALGDFAADLGVVDIGMVANKARATAPSRDNMLSLLIQGQQALDAASSGISSLPYFGNAQDLAKSAIAKAQGGLTYHKQFLAVDASDPYSKAADLKERVIAAFEAFNQVADGASYSAEQRGKVWGDIWDSIKDLPETIGGAIGTVIAGAAGGAAKGILSGLFSNPLGLVVVAGIGWYLLRGRG